MKSEPEVDRTTVVCDSKKLGLKDIFDLYESGKARRYGLLFSVHGGAFAIASFLAKDIKGRYLAGWGAIVLCIFMAIFTLLMYRDINEFGHKMRNLGGPLPLYTKPGRDFLFYLATLLTVAWFAVGVIGVGLVTGCLKLSP
jgi:hypothetical protein